MCKDTPAPDPKMAEAAMKSAQIGEDALTFYKSIYESDLKPMQQRQQGLAERIGSSYLEDADLARGIARQRLAEDEANRPLRDRMYADAMNYDSPEAIRQQMGIAAANVNQQFANALAQKARLESRYGRVGGSFGETNNALLAQAATASGLMTNAARETRDRAIGLRAGANEAAQGRSNTGGQYLGIAGNSMQGALGAGSSLMADTRANAGMMGQGYGIGLQGYGQAGSIYGQEFNARVQASNQDSGLGSLLGMGIKAGLGYATGGLSGAGNMLAGAKILA